MDEKTLFSIFNEIGEMQQCEGFCVTALYLNAIQLGAIKGSLTADDVNRNCLGRYRGIAVYPLDTLPKDELLGVYKGLNYSYVRM